MKKNIHIFLLLLTLFSCERTQNHKCVCYDNIGTDSTTYETYNVKNKKTLTESYCKSLSMPQKPCNLSE